MKVPVVGAHAALSVALLVGAACAVFGTVWAQTKPVKAIPADVQRGRYLVQIGGCNDCHTPGYANANGKVDEKLWLTGDKLQ